MSAKAELLGGAPGFARIRLHVAAGSKAISEIRIRRNQGTDIYLGLDGQWQVSPDCWHKIDTSIVAAVGERVDISIGPMLVDPIVRMQAGNAFMISWRAGEKVGAVALVLSSQCPLLASDARQASVLPNDESPSVEAPNAEPLGPVQDSSTATVFPRIQPPDLEGRIGRIEAQPHSRGALRAAGLGALLMVGTIGGIYWYFSNDTASIDGFSAAAPDSLSTREMLVEFMNEKPDAVAIIDKADEMMKAGNIDAATYLYRQGADRGDARSALQLGLLYAPDGPAIADSKLTKSSDTAAFWYGKAADAGLAEAQRRLGDILTKSHSPGTSEFEAGITWLKAASKQGDAEAATRIRELGQ